MLTLLGSCNNGVPPDGSWRVSHVEECYWMARAQRGAYYIVSVGFIEVARSAFGLRIGCGGESAMEGVCTLMYYGL